MYGRSTNAPQLGTISNSTTQQVVLLSRT